MKLNQDSITVNMVVKVRSEKYMSGSSQGTYRGKSVSPETSLSDIQRLIASGDFTAEFIPASFTTTSTGTLLIVEKEITNAAQ